MANITRPEFLRNTDLTEHLRWQKHTTDNVETLKTQATSPSYLAITRDAIGVSYANATTSQVSFNRLDEGTNLALGIPGTPGSSGAALSWSVASPKTIFVLEAGVYLLQAQFGWDISAVGTERSVVIYNPVRYENYGNVNGVKTGYNINSISWMGYLAEGDQLQLQVYQNSGGALLESVVPRLAALKLTL